MKGINLSHLRGLEQKRERQNHDENTQEGFESHVNSARQSGARIERFADANGVQT
jgi:hypothetical protein